MAGTGMGRLFVASRNQRSWCPAGRVGNGCGCGLRNRRWGRPGLRSPGCDQGQGPGHREQRAGQGSPVCRPSWVSKGRLVWDMDNHLLLVSVGLTNVRASLATLRLDCDVARRRRQDGTPGVEAASRRGRTLVRRVADCSAVTRILQDPERLAERARRAALAHGRTDEPVTLTRRSAFTISRSVSRWSLKAVRPSGVSFSHVRGHLPT